MDSQTVINSAEKLLQEMQDLSQPRSNFALRHFVIGQHDLPGRQYAQIIAELQALLFSLGDMNDSLELKQLDLEPLDLALEIEPDPRTRIERRRLAREIESLKIVIAGRVREGETLLELLNSMPRYTLEQIEAEELDYWQRRISRQYFEALAGGGNLDAAIQMFTEPGKAKPQLAGINDVLGQFNGLPLMREIKALQEGVK